MKIYTSQVDFLNSELRRLHEVNQMLLEALKPFVNDYQGWTEDDFFRGMARGFPPKVAEVHTALKAIAKSGEV